MLRIRQILALACLTAAEAVRQPVCLLLTLTCISVTALVPLLLMHAFGEEGKLARDAGFACHFLFGALVAGYAASSSLAREIRSGTASAVLSKPVDREVFFLAKFAGVAATVLAFSLCAGLATLLSERVAEKFSAGPRVYGYVTDWQTGTLLLAAPFAAAVLAGLINYRARRPFGSTAFGLLAVCLLLVLFVASFFNRAGQPAAFDPGVQWRIVPVSLLVTLALLVLAAIASSLATRLETGPILAVCLLVLALGLVSDYLIGRGAGDALWRNAAYRLLPNWQHFWVPDALTAWGTVPAAYLWRAGLYAVAYSAGILCLGVLSFRHAEMR